MDNHEKKPSLQLLTVIATPKLAEKAACMFLQSALPIQYRFHAEGTAPSEIMDMLGLGSVDKSVLIATVPRSLSSTMLGKLHSELQLDTINSGIAFTMPITGVNNLILRLMTQTATENDTDRKDEYGMAEARHVLITAIVNRGFSGDVMEAAKAAGARGGTVVPSRRIESEETAGFWGDSVQEEQEIVMILSDTEYKIPIMQKISEHCGMHSDAKGIVMSLPLDTVIGL